MTHLSLENLKCPECSGPMVPRTNRKDGTKFWGCKSFPKCKGTRDSMGMSKGERIAEEEKKSREVFGDEETDEYAPPWKRRYD